MKDCLVFDLDGTLVESLPGIAEGLNRALLAVGKVPHPPEAVRGMIGRGAENLCAAALGYADTSLAPAEELAALHAAFRREYPQCWQGQGTLPFDGIPEMLERLVAAGARVAVLTNKPQEVTGAMVPALFPAIPFDPVWGQSSQYPRKPDPTALRQLAERWNVPVERLTLVGDSMIDARSAMNAGCGCALVSWGYANPEQLASEGHAPLFHSVDALEAYLRGISGR